MGIVLRVEQGPEAGTSHVAKAGEVKIGRTKENDLVIKDPAASRAHARVFERGGSVYVEDLGSANGTRLNEEPLAPKAPVACQVGDDIGIGDTIIRLVPAIQEDAPSSGTLQDVGDAGPTPAPSDDAPGGYEPTRPRRPAVLAKGKSKETVVRAMAPLRRPGADGDDAEDPDDADAPADGFGDADVPEPGGETRSLATRPSAGRPSRVGLRGEPGAASELARADAGDNTDEEGLSAAERARLRRELARSAGGRAQLLWEDLPVAGRTVVVGGFLLACTASVALVGYYWIGPTTEDVRPEPNRLVPNGPTLQGSFGLAGAGAQEPVQWSTPDKKAFVFKVASSTQVVGVLHFSAWDISEGEVLVSLNGTDLQAVEPDTSDSRNRGREIVLPPKLIKEREDNTVLFDSARNPPGNEPWGIAELWLEVIPIPPMSEQQAADRAREALASAQKQYEARDVASGNLFRAWKTYREAWLLMEAMENPPVELQALARGRTEQLRPLLDQLCRTKALEFHRSVSKRPIDYEVVRTILTDIPTHFPSREHPCLGWSEANLKRLQDISHQVYRGPVGGER